jgi:ATP-binding cassette subfamily B protein
MKLFYNITAGNPGKLVKPILWTVVANLINILPFALAVAAIQMIYTYYAIPGASLNVTGLWTVCGALALSLPVMFLAEMPAYRTTYRGAYAVAAEGRAALAEHLRKLPLGYLTSRDPGDLGNMIMGDFSLIEHAITHLVPQVVGALVLPVIAFIGLCFLDVPMAMTMFAALPAAVLLLYGTSSLQKKLGASHMRAKIDMANRFQEYLNGLRVIKAYNLKGRKFSRLNHSLQEFMKESIRLEGLLGPVILTAIALVKAGMTLMVLAGVHLLLGGELDVVTLALFLVIGTRIFDPLTTALINFAEFRYDDQAGARIVDLLHQPVLTGGKKPAAAHHIAFEKVVFGYHGAVVLDNISFKISEGALTAIVGPSGSGKSTILRLMARFYDPQKGRVLLGGVDQKELEPEALLQKISMVFQDVYLFQDTIENNIGYGREGATREEIMRAAQKACCHDFIMALPRGYETMVGEGGSTLSGGEKQRISIARAILKDAPVVLLDEATASLDPENEVEVQKAINTLVQGRTVVVIAHRLKTVMGADHIIVLEQGRVAQQGKHQQLLDQKGLYARLWSIQEQMSGWQIG